MYLLVLVFEAYSLLGHDKSRYWNTACDCWLPVATKILLEEKITNVHMSDPVDDCYVAVHHRLCDVDRAKAVAGESMAPRASSIC
jgi:hypothetical protein